MWEAFRAEVRLLRWTCLLNCVSDTLKRHAKIHDREPGLGNSGQKPLTSGIPPQLQPDLCTPQTSAIPAQQLSGVGEQASFPKTEPYNDPATFISNPGLEVTRRLSLPSPSFLPMDQL